MKTTEKDALHIVAIVRALHDAQRFLGGLSAEEFAENDEKAECRCHSDCTSGGSKLRSCQTSSGIWSQMFLGVG